MNDGTGFLIPVNLNDPFFQTAQDRARNRATSSKFQDAITERIYGISMDGCAIEFDGGVDDYGTYVELLHIDSFPETPDYPEDDYAIGDWHILMEDSQGFVYSESFYTEAECRARWDEVTERYRDAEEDEEEDEED